MYKRVLVPLDGSARAEHAIPVAARIARAFGGSIIAMATHGRGGVQHWALGSITERVLHATKLPLLIMRPP